MAQPRKKRASVAQAPERKHGFSPKWLATLVGCGLAIYIVVKRVDHVSEVKAAGAGITFRDNASPTTLSPDQQREMSQQIQAKVEAALQQAVKTTPEPPPSPVDLTGTWSTPDGRATWTVTVENGYLVTREQYPESPNVVTAVGYGSFDGHTWSLQLQNILGATGRAALHLVDDDTLRGEVILGGQRFSLTLQR